MGIFYQQLLDAKLKHLIPMELVSLGIWYFPSSLKQWRNSVQLGRMTQPYRRHTSRKT